MSTILGWKYRSLVPDSAAKIANYELLTLKLKSLYGPLIAQIFDRNVDTNLHRHTRIEIENFFIKTKHENLQTFDCSTREPTKCHEHSRISSNEDFPSTNEKETPAKNLKIKSVYGAHLINDTSRAANWRARKICALHPWSHLVNPLLKSHRMYQFPSKLEKWKSKR